MFGYVLYSPTDPTHRTLEVSHPSLLPPVDEDEIWIETPDLPAKQWMAVEGPGGPELVPFEHPAPIKLALAVEAAILAVHDRPDVAEFSGCMTALGRVQTDATSQRKINGAAFMAYMALQQGQPYTITWTMEDNSNVAHTATQIINAGIAVGLHVNACHQNRQALKDLIEAATTAEQVAEIDLDQGWP